MRERSSMDAPVAVKDNDFEKLIKELAQKQKCFSEEDERSKLNLRRKRHLALAIASVYYFLRVALNLSEKFALTAEHFETAEAELKRTAEKEERKIRRKIRKFLGLKSAWGYYLEHEHFSIRRAPVRGKQRWYYVHPWSNMKFDPNLDWSSYNTVPPNYQALLKDLFQKRYPNVQVPEK